MSRSCCPVPADTPHNTSVCPATGTAGAPVGLMTVKALLTTAALSRLRVIDYRFCSDPSCDVVYFDAFGGCYRRSDIRVPVWQKEPFGARLVCYCFGETEATIRHEIEANGASRAAVRVRGHIAAKRCACEMRPNAPQMACARGRRGAPSGS